MEERRACMKYILILSLQGAAGVLAWGDEAIPLLGNRAAGLPRPGHAQPSQGPRNKNGLIIP